MKASDQTIAYTLARIGMGVNFAVHGLVRLPKLEGFANYMTGNFEKTILPSALVKPYAYGLPIIELILGILMILGLFTRKAFIASALVMISLIFGTCMLENWATAGSQMVYLAYITVLLALREKYNELSLDDRKGC
ncbi:MAG: DoxX family protein [Akkermansiaceae bacterium]